MAELAIDTAGPLCCVSLAFGDPQHQHILTEVGAAGRGQAEQVLALVDQLFEASGQSYAGLETILSVVGPGSFTGVRVGVALAKGLALASEARLVGVTRSVLVCHSFCLHGSAPSFQGVIACLLPAGRGEFYCEVFNVTGAVFERSFGPSLVGEEALSEYLAGHQVEGLAGPVDAGVAETLSEQEIQLPYHDVPLAGGDFFAIKKCFLLEGEGVKPLYLRAPDAKPQLGKALKRSGQ